MSADRPSPPAAGDAAPVLVLEGNGDGHRFYYVRLLADAILAAGGRPVLVTRPGQMDSPQAVEFLAGLPASFRSVEVARADVASASVVARRLGARRIVVPDGDRHLVSLVTRRGRDLPHVTALVMREPVLRRDQPLRPLARQWLKRATMTLAGLRRSTTVTVLKSSVWAGRSRFPVAQDPVTLAATPADVAAFRERWDMGADRRWFGVVGAITARKNLPLVAEALARVADEGVGLFVGGAVFDGQLAAAEPHLAEARRRGARVVVVDRMLEDVEPRRRHRRGGLRRPRALERGPERHPRQGRHVRHAPAPVGGREPPARRGGRARARELDPAHGRRDRDGHGGRAPR
ncbi:hypothetical protein [Clavibacter tessellarius]|uniref:hypothetical protein n=1 Tax=Clavibacter tessellarius TaxID=31965 RepID=UPI003252D0B0